MKYPLKEQRTIFPTNFLPIPFATQNNTYSLEVCTYLLPHIVRNDDKRFPGSQDSQTVPFRRGSCLTNHGVSFEYILFPDFVFQVFYVIA